MLKKLFLLLYISICCLSQILAEVTSPSNLKLVRATYTKITIQWQNDGDASQIASYKVLRNDSEIATTSGTDYIDNGLASGTIYTYKVVAISTGGEASVPSTALTVSTIKSVNFENSDKVESVVDSFHSVDPSSSTAASLIAGIKSGLESLLGTNITFSVIDSDTFSTFVDEELAVIKTVSPEMTEAERQAAQTELNQFLTDSYGGNSFEHVYMQSKLTELGDKHWEKGNKVAAMALYEFSLKYLSNQENIVSNSLHRMAHFQLQEITETSTKQEIVAALDASRDTVYRFFDFFPGSSSQQAMMIYNYVYGRYYTRFTEQLPYEDYNYSFFNTAKQSVTAMLAIDDSEMNRKKFEKVDAWELINLNVDFKDSSGNPLTGSVKVCNVTANTEYSYLFPNTDSMFTDERNFQIVNGQATIPVYKGHIYNFDLTFNIDGGVPLTHTIELMPYVKGQALTYDNLATPTTAAQTDPNSSSAIFVLDKPNYPYNLTHESSIDVFHLKWDWLESDSFTVKYYKVFRGATVIDTVTEKIAKNIPFESPDGIFTYFVQAYDENDNPSPMSKSAMIVPEDTTPYADYFAWLQTYFGDQKTLSSDDPDGDGVSNYQEFLNGTDPSRIPGPQNVYAKQTTFTKLTLAWEPLFEGEEGVTYKIYRNETEVGTSSTNSFTDSSLTPGLTFTYQIKAVKQDGWDSEKGLATALTTQKPLTSEYAAELQQIIDQFNPLIPTEYTGVELVNAVKTGLEAILGTNITFSVLDEQIIKEFTEEELAMLREVVPPMTAAERLAARNELNTFLTEHYGNNSFEHVYMQSKLAELADKHYLKGNIQAATALYEISLNYLKDQENIVSNTLSRLAYFKTAAITETSTDEEIIAALNGARDTRLRFFDFFPESTSHQALMLYGNTIGKYYSYFPTLLKYDDYHQDVFNTTSQLSDALVNLNSDETYLAKQNKVKAWELVSMNVSIAKPDGSSAPGTLIITNVSKGLFSEDLPVDERQYRLDGSSVNIPVYLGHNYKLTALFDVEGGPAIKYIIDNMLHGKGQQVTYDHFDAPVTTSLPEGNNGAEISFITSQPTYPYNLEADILPDEFTLTWAWIPPANYQLKYFKIYRGDTEIGTATEQQLSHIPRVLSADSAYSYRVTAVDINDVETSFSPTLNVYPEFTEEEQKYFDWKKSYFGDTPMFAYDDPDNDGLTNYQEFLLGSNPTVAPSADPKAGLTNIIPGIKVNYYKGVFSKMPLFDKLTPYKSDVLDSFFINNDYDELLTSNCADGVAMVFTAYFDAPVDGKYRFYLVDDDGARLYIDNSLTIDHDASGWMDGYADIYLAKGSHSFKLEYFERVDRAVLQLYWAGPTFTRCEMNNTCLWYTTDNDTVLAEVVAWQRDSDLDGIRDLEENNYHTSNSSSDTDGDGLTDYEEINIYHTNALKADSDDDGVNDYEEVKVAFSNALVADFNGTSNVLQHLTGSSYVGSTYGWEKEGDITYCSARNGSVTYNLTIPQKGVYALEVSGGEKYYYSETSENGELINQSESEFNIDLYVNEKLCGSRVLKVTGGNIEKVRFYLPELASGSASAKLVWNNVTSNTFLKINSLELLQVNGPDANANGKADWVDNRIDNMSEVVIPTSSRTSPLYIEGVNALFLDQINITIDGKPSANSNENSWKLPWSDGETIQWLSPNTPASKLEGLTEVSPQPAHGARNTWFANVPLYPGNGLSGITVSLQDGAKTVEQNVSWTPTNVMLDEDMTIRAGDSLFLMACPQNNTDGTTVISVNGEELTLTAGKTPYEFKNAGTYTVSAVFTPADGTEAINGEMTVKVVSASFAGAPYAIVGLDRDWTNPAIPEAAGLDFDDTLTVYRAIKADGSSNIAFYGRQAGDAYITARLGENGPVMAASKINIIDVATHKADGYYEVIDTFDDGSRMIEGKICLSNVPGDLKIKIRVYTAGATFLDGTVEKTLTAADFDESGVCRYRLLKSAESPTSTCHGISFYQGDTYINSYRNW